MPKGNESRIKINLKSSESGHTYTTVKNKKNDQQRMELKKYDPFVRKHVTYKEMK